MSRGARAVAIVVRAAALSIVLLAVAFAGSAYAFSPPELRGHVVDTSHKLSEDDIARLNAELDAEQKSRGVEIVAFLVGSLGDDNIEDLTYDTFKAWGVGSKGADNGVLLVIAPNERKVRIETGKGVGADLTDLQANDIIRKTIEPLLKEGRYADAVEAGTREIATTAGQNTKDHPPATKTPVPIWQWLLYLGLAIGVIVLAIVSPGFRSVLFFFLMFGRGGGGGGGSGGAGSDYRGGGGTSGGGGSSDSY